MVAEVKGACEELFGSVWELVEIFGEDEDVCGGEGGLGGALDEGFEGGCCDDGNDDFHLVEVEGFGGEAEEVEAVEG